MTEVKKKKRYINFSTAEYAVGAHVPMSAVYECSACEELTAFRRDERFVRCDACKDEQTWYRTNEFIHFVSKNLNTEFERVETIGLKIADWIAEVAGSVWFALLHVAWFWFWIHVNTGKPLLGLGDFDPYPFGLLTMIVSLEAIFLATFILISQNRQAQKSELRAELDYQTNLNTEKNVAEVLAILHELRDAGKLEAQTEKAILSAVKKQTKGARPSRRKNVDVREHVGIDVVQEE